MAVRFRGSNELLRASSIIGIILVIGIAERVTRRGGSIRFQQKETGRLAVELVRAFVQLVDEIVVGFVGRFRVGLPLIDGGRFPIGHEIRGETVQIGDRGVGRFLVRLLLPMIDGRRLAVAHEIDGQLDERVANGLLVRGFRPSGSLVRLYERLKVGRRIGGRLRDVTQSRHEHVRRGR